MLKRSAIAGGPGILRSLAFSWRFTEIDRTDGSLGPPKRRAIGEIYALWHQHLLMLMLRHRDEEIAVMISRSRDGDLASPIVERLGFEVVRGSSSRGGSQALDEMVRAADEGHALALTVDGPRGPARRSKPGAVLIASRAGVPLVPVVAIPASARCLDSWDRFLVPYPRSRVYLAYGEPIPIPTSLAPGDVRGWQRALDNRLEHLVNLCESAAQRRWPKYRPA
ncbi:MAG: lysophospholipid acyltransferase family protein [marine benthic group bacterium]|nr:lysophospholipid acyltransferase family protein [Gemmatimonadota bacterium]MCL7977470.1 lysophospholipid acyltransferase family protein [Gemmatimonadota bacterium]